MVKENYADKLSRVMLGEFQRVHDRFDVFDRRFVTLEAQYSSLMSEVAAIHRRLDSLEQAIGNVLGFAKEIDHLLKRVVEIEKHLGLNAHIKA